mgnify:CR=1 FL=1
MTNWYVVSGITFAVFLTEALIHYNYGISESSNQPLTLSNFQFPKGNRLLLMAGIVLLASTVSGSLVTLAEKKMA